MHDGDGNAALTGKSLQSRQCRIILVVAVVLAERPYGGKGVDDDQPGLGTVVEPFGQIVDPAFIETTPVESKGEPFRPDLIVTNKDVLQPPLQPPRIVLQRDVEHVAMHRHKVTEADARSGNRDGDIEGHPGFALLRTCRQAVSPLR